jgi:hypothetical protein
MALEKLTGITNYSGGQIPGTENLTRSEYQEVRADRTRKESQDTRTRRDKVRRSLKCSG